MIDPAQQAALEGQLHVNAPAERRCIRCTHFRNSPRYLESAIQGLRVMGSGHASVRRDDGICLLHDLFLSADAWCDSFERASTSP